MSRPGSLSYAELCDLEVEWYEKHGQYPTRIKVGEFGTKYVESDYFWNQHHLQAIEVIKERMAEGVGNEIYGYKI